MIKRSCVLVCVLQRFQNALFSDRQIDLIQQSQRKHWYLRPCDDNMVVIAACCPCTGDFCVRQITFAESPVVDITHWPEFVNHVMAITGDFADRGYIVVIHWGPKRGGCHGHAVANCGGRDLFSTRRVRIVRSPCGLALTESQRNSLCRSSADVAAPLPPSAYQGIIRLDDDGMLNFDTW